MKAVVAARTGEIIELEGFAPVGMAGTALIRLTEANTIDMPFGGELMLLPDRIPILYNLAACQFEPVRHNPYQPDEPIFPVAAFNSPGYVNVALSAYIERQHAQPLPLFSYGAVGCHHGSFRTPLILVDAEKRQDLRFMQRSKVMQGIKRMRKLMPSNRLRKHLEKCALVYGCPAAKNFFLSRFEAPLPTSAACNARCLGCLSGQPEKSGIPCSQERIPLKPSPTEIAQVALAHIQRVKNSVVSFGQGCEGDPLLAADVILPGIEQIRAQTDRGTVNMNTNGGLPKVLEALWSAGLDSVRISLNSVREACYHAYFRPQGYNYQNVMTSIDHALSKGKFVSINYLNCPGFTDSEQEAEALMEWLHHYPISMIQWRNLNFDPLNYYRFMDKAAASGESIGMEQLITMIRHRFPHIIHGYFNPPKEQFSV